GFIGSQAYRNTRDFGHRVCGLVRQLRPAGTGPPSGEGRANHGLATAAAGFGGGMVACQPNDGLPPAIGEARRAAGQASMVVASPTEQQEQNDDDQREAAAVAASAVIATAVPIEATAAEQQQDNDDKQNESHRRAPFSLS